MSVGRSAGGPPTVGIVGLGLIGGSLAQSLRGNGRRVVATTRRPEVREAANAFGVEMVDDLQSLIDAADVVVIAAALDAVPELVAGACALSAASSRRPTITDVGSVKAPVAAAIDPAHRDVFVGGHPMAGTEHAGWESADPALFHDRTWALALDTHSDLRRWADVAGIAVTVGSLVVPIDADEHDLAVVRVSHLPYVLAALAAGAVAPDARQDAGLLRALAAGSYDSLTRVAAGHPTLGAEMAWANRSALAAAVNELRDRLGQVAEALGDADRDAIEDLFAIGQQGRSALMARALAGAEQSLNLDLAGLLALGRAGGAILQISSEIVDGHVAVEAIDPRRTP